MKMRFTTTVSIWWALRLLSPAEAAPGSQGMSVSAKRADSGYWVSSIERQGTVPYGGAVGYKVFRNILDYGAKGDGSTDDTDAINNAVSDGGRCGRGCASSTMTPAIVYFPPGTYRVSKPIIQYYYTQFVGDVVNPPTIKASADFKGMAVIDSDPYGDDGTNWWVNQNQFFRQIRNMVIDLTDLPASAGAGIHWQCSQATSLQNIVFNMHQGGDDNAQLGIFMDNGSGGFMSDLTFNGGKYGAFFGSQQFTTRNMTFNNCKTAIYMNWNWLWTLQDVKINNCHVGIDMSNGGTSQTVGSVLVLDSVISNTDVGINTAYETSSSMTNGTLIVENVDMSTGVPIAINGTAATVLAGNQKIASFVQGKTYSGTSATLGKAVQGPEQNAALVKPKVLTTEDNKVFTRSKPQYGDVPASQFISVKSHGAKGDGVSDDTAAIQKIFDDATDDQIIFFDHGAYLITDTVKVPKNIKITGEVWPMIVAGGDKSFADQASPKPVFQVGQPGDIGAVEMSDLIFQTAGPQPGAVMIEWNVATSSQGAAAMWDVHVRIGGSVGSQLQLNQCAKNPNATHSADPKCIGAFLMFHVRGQASVYLENTWFWVADHDLEKEADSQQIDIYNGRGVLVESSGAVWGWGTASEHSQLYNYQISNASNVYLSLIQTETPYMQGNPDATTPFNVNTAYNDPDFKNSCDADSKTCARSWGLRAVDSKDVFVYGAGLYTFFNNYDQTCVEENNCQDNMVSLEGDTSGVHMYMLTTKASVNMLSVDGKAVVQDKDNRNVFGATLASYGQ